MKILFINTNQIVQKLVEVTAQKANVELETVSDPSQVSDIEQYDYIIADDGCYNMDKKAYDALISGRRACLIYSKHEEMSEGFSEYIKKPFIPTHILEIMVAQIAKVQTKEAFFQTTESESNTSSQATPNAASDDEASLQSSPLEHLKALSEEYNLSETDSNQSADTSPKEIGKDDILGDIDLLEDGLEDLGAAGLSADLDTKDTDVSEATLDADSQQDSLNLDDLDLGDFGDLDNTSQSQESETQDIALENTEILQENLTDSLDSDTNNTSEEKQAEEGESEQVLENLTDVETKEDSSTQEEDLGELSEEITTQDLDVENLDLTESQDEAIQNTQEVSELDEQIEQIDELEALDSQEGEEVGEPQVLDSKQISEVSGILDEIQNQATQEETQEDVKEDSQQDSLNLDDLDLGDFGDLDNTSQSQESETQDIALENTEILQENLTDSLDSDTNNTSEEKQAEEGESEQVLENLTDVETKEDSSTQEEDLGELSEEITTQDLDVENLDLTESQDEAIQNTQEVSELDEQIEQIDELEALDSQEGEEVGELAEEASDMDTEGDTDDSQMQIQEVQLPDTQNTEDTEEDTQDFQSLDEQEILRAVGEEAMPTEPLAQEDIAPTSAAPATPPESLQDGDSNKDIEVVTNALSQSIQDSIKHLQSSEVTALLDGMEVTINISFKDTHK